MSEHHDAEEFYVDLLNLRINMFDDEELIEAAKTVYEGYDPEEMILYSDQEFPYDCCDLATAYLQRKLGGEVVHGFYDDNSHTFLLLGGNIVDITADQFDDGPEIYHGPLVKPWSLRSLPGARINDSL